MISPIATATVVLYSGSSQVGSLPSSQYRVLCKNFRDPRGRKELRGLSGLSEPVMAFMREDVKVEALINDILLLSHDAHAQDTHWVSFLFVDHHGDMIAPAVAEIAKEALDAAGYRVGVQHYGCTRR